MPQYPFDSEIINTREQILSNDLDIIGNQPNFALREFLKQSVIASKGSFEGVLNNPDSWPSPFNYKAYSLSEGFRIKNTTSPLVVAAQAGTAFQYVPFLDSRDLGIGGTPGVEDRSSFKTLYLSQNQNFTVPSTSFTGRRVDLIEARFRNDVTDLVSRNVYASPGHFTPEMVAKTLTHDLYGQIGYVNAPSDSTAHLGYKVGVVNPSGIAVVPSITYGYAPLCEIWIEGGATPVITQRHIADRREIYSPHGIKRASFQISKACNHSTYSAGALYGIQAPPGVWIANYDSLWGITTNVGAYTTFVLAVPGSSVFSYNISVNILNAMAAVPLSPNRILTPMLKYEGIIAPEQGRLSWPNVPYGMYLIAFTIMSMSTYIAEGTITKIQQANDAITVDPDPIIYGVSVEWF